MKKSILNLGKALNKVEQKSINGGKAQCDRDHACGPTETCVYYNSTYGICYRII
jgi:hypothetical protein